MVIDSEAALRNEGSNLPIPDLWLSENPLEEPAGKKQLSGKLILWSTPWQDQVRVMEELYIHYRAEYIGIDHIGPGDGVFGRVQAFCPRAVGMHNNPDVKTKLAIKAQQIVADQGLEHVSIHSDITAGFMQIKSGPLPSMSKITYTCDCSDQTGHTDAAWAVARPHQRGPPRPRSEAQDLKVVFAD